MISMFPFQHSGHTFKPIDNEYDEHVHKVMDDLGLLKRRHTELISLVQDVVRNNGPVHEISNNVVCATSKALDQPAHTHSLIRAFASRLSIL